MQRTQNIPGSTTILTVSNEDVNTIPFEDITSNTLDGPVFDSVLDIVSVQAKLVFYKILLTLTKTILRSIAEIILQTPFVLAR